MTEPEWESNRDYRCATCRDTGVVWARRKGRPLDGTWAFLCVCDQGAKSSKKLPSWLHAGIQFEAIE